MERIIKNLAKNTVSEYELFGFTCLSCLSTCLLTKKRIVGQDRQDKEDRLYPLSLYVGVRVETVWIPYLPCLMTPSFPMEI